jgi:hypothetical protein
MAFPVPVWVLNETEFPTDGSNEEASIKRLQKAGWGRLVKQMRDAQASRNSKIGSHCQKSG